MSAPPYGMETLPLSPLLLRKRGDLQEDGMDIRSCKPIMHEHFSRCKKYPDVIDERGNKRKIRHYCIVTSCIITEHSRKDRYRKFNFYRIPSDKRNPVRRRAWCEAIRPNEPNWNPSQWTRVCELHFMGGDPGKNGVPSLRLGNDKMGTINQDWTSGVSNGTTLYTEDCSMALQLNPESSISMVSREEPASLNSSLRTTHNQEYLANRIKLIRSTVSSLTTLLMQDEASLAKINPDHPILASTNEDIELLSGEALLSASRQLDPVAYASSTQFYMNHTPSATLLPVFYSPVFANSALNFNS